MRMRNVIKTGGWMSRLTIAGAAVFVFAGALAGLYSGFGETWIKAAPPETTPFSGTYTPTACGIRHAFPVGVGKTSIVVVAGATVAANDIVLNFYSEGPTTAPGDDIQISSVDTGTSPEAVTYQPAGGVPPDTYKAEVCPFTAASQVTPPPIQYNGTFTTDDAPIGGTPTPTPPATPTPHPPSNPTRSTGNITFGPMTVGDLQRTEAEPLNFIDRNGNTLSTGPYGASTTTSVLQRSTDGGDSYHVVAFNGLRPNPGTGGGDSDVIVDDQGFMYFIDLEALVNLGCAVSNDNGNNWKTNSTCVQDAGDDRQWFALDSGASLASATDNTIFVGYRQVPLGSLIYSSPGSTGTADAVGGVVYQNASSVGTTVNDGAPCGQMRFDSIRRNLYYPCGNGNNVKVTIGKVNPGQRTGIQFRTVTTPGSPGGGDVRGVFPVVATDAGGNVYVAWLDANDRNVYYTYSNNEGGSWSPPVRVNSAPSQSAVFPWIQGGAAGNLVVQWYGLDGTSNSSDNLPNWATNPATADDFKWFGYAALITNAASSTPNIEQNRFTRHPMHYGQICTGGLGCATGGDRTMAEYGAVYLDSAGAMRLIINDTSSQHHGAHLFAVRQLTGPTAKGGTVNRPEPQNPMTDVMGDAQTPHYSPAGTGANLPQLDFTSVRISQPNASTLRFHMRLNSLASILPPAGKASAFWMMRFQALSNADTAGAEAHRVFYVGAETAGGPAPIFSFFAGSPTLNGPPSGCTQTTPGNCKIAQYPAEITATGERSGNTICVDMPLTMFGAARPINGTTLFSVTAFSGGRNNSTADIHTESDASAAFDYVLGSAGVAACDIVTAATASLGGRVTDESGRPMSGAVVTVQNSGNGEILKQKTNRRGLFEFPDLATGESYVLTVSRRGWYFTPENRLVNLLEEVGDANFVGTRIKSQSGVVPTSKSSNRGR